MATTHPTRIFASGNANTLFLTIPARVVTDSQFPFDADDEVTVAIDGDRLVISPVGTEERVG